MEKYKDTRLTECNKTKTEWQNETPSQHHCQLGEASSKSGRHSRNRLSIYHRITFLKEATVPSWKTTRLMKMPRAGSATSLPVKS